MDENVDEMVPKDVQLSKLVIQGKGEIHDRPGLEKLPNGKIIGQIPNFYVVLNLASIIKDKGSAIYIAVDDSDSEGN
jgi:hypothetical protein